MSEAGGAQSVAVSMRGISKSYGNLRVLSDVSLDVPRGSFLTMLGPSGSGKTTLLMVIAGFVRPERGNLFFNDKEIILDPPEKRDIGMVFQSYALFPHLDVYHNVAYPLRIRGVAKDEIKRRVDRALAMVQLQKLGERQIHQISGGQRQRVALARAMVFEPRVLLMDEPLSALDKTLREEMQLEIKRLHDEWGTTTICVTHDQREALTMSDSVAIMDGGKVIQLAAPQDIYNRPSNRFVASFVGEATFLPAEKRDGKLVYKGSFVETPADLVLPHNPVLVLRPERLRLVGDGKGAGLNVFEGVVTTFTFQGDSAIMSVALSGDETVYMRGQSRHALLQSAPEIGRPVRLGIAPADVIVVEDEQ